MSISSQRIAAAILAVLLLFAASTDYVPAFRDASGKVFGLFALDGYKDALHVASGTWAALAAWRSQRAAVAFLKIFGGLYLADGILGVFTGSGFLDLSILTVGVSTAPELIKVLSSVPHLALGAFGVVFGWFGGRRPHPAILPA